MSNIQIDPTQPIVYGRPRYLAPVLAVLTAAVLVVAVVVTLTYSNVNAASQQDVLGNRAVTRRVEKLLRRIDRLERTREEENHSHRERNELAHACILQRQDQIETLLRGRSTNSVDYASPEPCKQYGQAGEVPPPASTTTQTTTRRTTTTRRRTSTTPATTAPPSSSTGPTTTTTACAVRVQGQCRPVPTP